MLYSLPHIQDLLDDYDCICRKGYFGHDCENMTNRCLPRPCQNGAECSTVNDDYQCNCLEEFKVQFAVMHETRYMT